MERFASRHAYPLRRLLPGQRIGHGIWDESGDRQRYEAAQCEVFLLNRGFSPEWFLRSQHAGCKVSSISGRRAGISIEHHRSRFWFWREPQPAGEWILLRQLQPLDRIHRFSGSGRHQHQLHHQHRDLRSQFSPHAKAYRLFERKLYRQSFGIFEPDAYQQRNGADPDFSWNRLAFFTTGRRRFVSVYEFSFLASAGYVLRPILFRQEL